MSKEFVVEFNDKELGECRIYQENLMGYSQAIKDMKIYKAKQSQKIADLEAKLAESEADKKALICDYESRITKEQELMSWLEHNNEELKQQLAESEEKCNKQWLEIQAETHQIQMLEQDIKRIKKGNKQQLAEKEKQIAKLKELNLDIPIKQMQFHHNQDKISFAVAELEKAKIEFETYYADNIWNYPQYLEDRIKLLKEGK